MKSKRVNSQALVESICCVSFAAVMWYLLASGKYLSYVTPRMQPYLYFAAAVMLLWAATSLTGVFRLQYRKRTAHCFICLLPILLLLLPHGEIGMSNLSGATGVLTANATGSLSGTGKGGNRSGGAPGAQPQASQAGANAKAAESAAPSSTPGEAEKTVPAPKDKAASQAGTQDTYPSTNAYGEPMELHGYDAKNKRITVQNEEFYNWVGAVTENLDQFEGFQITITGAVYKDASIFAKNEFVPARLVMTCCVADLSPSGIVCHYDKAPTLKSDAWVTVTGKLYRGKYEGQDEPQIEVTSIKPAAPIKGYIYPFP